MPRVAFKTLGCRLNQADTDHMAEDLAAAGFEIVREDQRPDVVIVNTCTVTSEATRSSRRTASKAAESNPESLVVVAGCYAVAEREDASALPGVGLVVSNDDKDGIVDLISEKLSLRPHAPSGFLKTIPFGVPGADRTRTNLRVQTGCDEFCSFCIIPKTRGPLRSFPLEDLLKRARRQVAEGARELVLTGVHLGKYGWDVAMPDDGLVELLEGLLAIDGLARIRLSSILCRHLSPRVIGLIRDEARICRFLHIPLQSGDDTVLERMNRPYRIGEYLGLIERVKEAVPEVGLSTDVIVGFPGETREQFEATARVAEEVGFLKIHVFRYSPRPGTPSAGWPDQIDEREKRLRSKELIALGNRTRLAFHERQIGRVREVFVEQAFDNGMLSGHTDNFVMVRCAGPRALAHRLAKVEVESAAVDSVTGSLVGEVAWEQADPRGGDSPE